jgi:1-acyl-sn-glycerol-3-phosphate acyltransferase
MSKVNSSFLFPTKTTSWLYSVLYPWVAKGIDLFVDDLEVDGLQNIPKEGPLMLVANHQNAMFDPLICCRVFPRQLHWLTRSDVFKNKKIASFLHAIHMLPIYREKDNVADQMERNEEVFKVCRERLSKGAVIAMFPEGSHRGKKQLMTPLKKGFARLAFSSIEKDSRLMNLKVLPMALDYSSFVEYQPKILLKIGRPIPVRNFWDQYLEDQSKAINLLVKETSESLSSLMIDIRDNEHYDDLMLLSPLFSMPRSEKAILGFTRYQKFIQEWPSMSESAKSNCMRYLEIAHEMEIHPQSMVLYSSRNWKIQIAYFVEWFPAALGRLIFGPLYFLTEKFIRKKVKDELFYNSIRLAFFTFLTPFYCLLIMGVIMSILPFRNSLEVMVGFLFLVAIGLFSISWNKTRRVRREINKAKRAQLQFPQLWQEAMELQSKIISHD